jgi:drug/metabolite transporter (DMT)-like permease
MKKPLFFGILASFFFAFTFVLNRSMNLAGGHWLWSAPLRYFFTLPLLWVLVKRQNGLAAVLRAIRNAPGTWLLWSTVGFGLFYLPLTWASVYGESWFVAATWQLTIIAGVFTTPLFGKKIPGKNVLCALVILAGIFLLQASHFRTMETAGMVTALALILVAAFAYPLGNRKMMASCPPDLTTIQRVFGMTLCSIPFWLAAAVVAGVRHGAPSGGQLVQSFVVALFSGVVATLLFFEATNLTKHDPKRLAVIEATQSGEVLFTLLGGILFLGDSLPTPTGWVGIALIVLGMIANSLASASS